jgi:hypothetical protein
VTLVGIFEILNGDTELTGLNGALVTGPGTGGICIGGGKIEKGADVDIGTLVDIKGDLVGNSVGIMEGSRLGEFDGFVFNSALGAKLVGELAGGNGSGGIIEKGFEDTGKLERFEVVGAIEIVGEEVELPSGIGLELSFGLTVGFNEGLVDEPGRGGGGGN